MLGKRGRRPPMKRTTSMTEFTLDLTAPSTNYSNGNTHPQSHHPLNGVDHRHDNTAPSRRPLPHRRNSADFVETAQFLRLCSLCNRRLIPGHDIYMYRGDNAFCSLECRQHKMAQDERKDKKLFEAPTTVAVTGVPQVSTTPATAGETVTAVV